MNFLFRSKFHLLAWISPVVVVLDQWTKHLILDRFYLGESTPIINGFFNLVHIRNRGAAFGFLSDSDPAFRVPFFLIVPVIALFIIIFIFRKIPKSDRLIATALALVIGGAIGNLIDRIRFGYVVDFLDFYWKTYHFPAFNIADSAICVGVGILLLDLVMNPESSLDNPKGKTNASRTV